MAQHVLGCKFRKGLSRNIFFRDFRLDVLECEVDKWLDLELYATGPSLDAVR